MSKVDISNLPHEQQEQILDWLDRAKKVYLTDENRTMTLQEAAEAYGYEYGTIRIYVHKGDIASIGKGRDRRVSHAAMREYIRNRGIGGRRTNKELP